MKGMGDLAMKGVGDMAMKGMGDIASDLTNSFSWMGMGSGSSTSTSASAQSAKNANSLESRKRDEAHAEVLQKEAYLEAMRLSVAQNAAARSEIQSSEHVSEMLHTKRYSWKGGKLEKVDEKNSIDRKKTDWEEVDGKWIRKSP